jgi:3'-phosphoadenosine 5'-phosphosulfate sulfotransferase (PAPS reductase)/FAD synthetase
VDEWLPIHHWTAKQVWRRIKEKGIPYHPVYHLGMPRLSCMFCVLASRAALVLAARLNPKGARKRLLVEQLMVRRRLITSAAFALNRLAGVPLTRLEWRFYRGINQAGWKFQPNLSMAEIVAEAEALGPIGTTVDEWRANVPRELWVEDVEAVAGIEDWAA